MMRANAQIDVNKTSNEPSKGGEKMEEATAVEDRELERVDRDLDNLSQIKEALFSHEGMTVDPYGTTVTLIAETIAFGLRNFEDMSPGELSILMTIGHVVQGLDLGVKINGLPEILERYGP